jgi:hypothetical protein
MSQSIQTVRGPEFFETNNRSQRAANQTLNLYAATIEATSCDYHAVSASASNMEASNTQPLANHRSLPALSSSGAPLLRW